MNHWIMETRSLAEQDIQKKSRLIHASYSHPHAVWDSKPPKPGAPINWVELKTSAEMRNDRDRDNFERKLLKFWIQSFLLGVPRIIVGFRSRDGILQRVEDMDVASIPDTVARQGRQWDGNICTNFAAGFLECESSLSWQMHEVQERADQCCLCSQGSGPGSTTRVSGESVGVQGTLTLKCTRPRRLQVMGGY